MSASQEHPPMTPELVKVKEALDREYADELPPSPDLPVSREDIPRFFAEVRQQIIDVVGVDPCADDEGVA